MTASSPSFLRRWIFSIDHKVIALQYLISGLFFLGFGGIMALIIRWQVAHPWQPVPLLGQFIFREAGGAVTPEVYPMLFTMHGTIMVFFAVTPILLGTFGNYLIPLEVGSRDMAFPHVNMLSFWFLFTGSLLVLLSFFVPGGAAGSGWTVYAPLSSSTTVSPGWGQDLFILGLALDAVSIMMGGINYITTIFQLRAPGMNLRRLPLTLWGLFYSSVLNTLWLPLVAAALFMVLADRRLGTAFFTAGPLAPRAGGQVLLYQHLFWGFGHPEVYILILPVWGMVADFLSIFSRKPAFGYTATVISMCVVTALSGIVWGHHMFTAGMNPLVGKGFMVLTILVSVPTAVFFLNWLATLWRGSLRFPTPMLFTLGVVFVFSIGGLTGLFNAMQAFDVYIHDTYFVVGHFHFTLAASVLLGVFGFIYFWFPKMFGVRLNEGLGKLHFWITFLSLNVLFTVMMITGLYGHMRRIADPSAYEFLAPIQHWQPVLFWSASIMVAAQFIFLVNLVITFLRKEKSEPNPWQSTTLAWTTSSPPPVHNFDVTPTVYCGPHEFSVPGVEGQDWIMQNDPRGATFGKS
ncbi:MAG: Alternative cytochrome c oxidase subunit 1 [Elusimicrobia bacterium]|nr:Alternative cytochrome c oxidase subunit 1 [Elusimicrobiota bacterium]